MNQTTTDNITNKERFADKAETHELDLGYLIASILDSGRVVILVTFLFAALAAVYAILATPVFKANALIQVEEKSSGVLGLDGIEDMFVSDSSTDTEIFILKSRYVVGQTVDDLNLTNVVRPNYFPVVGNFFVRRHKKSGLAEPLWGTSYAWGGEIVRVADFNVSKNLLMREFTLVAEEDGQFSLWLNDNLVLTGAVGETVFSDSYDVNINLAELVANKGTNFTLIKRSRLKAIMAVQKKYTAVSLSKDAGIIEMSLVGENKRSIVEILSSLSTNYVLQNVRRLAAEAESSLQFLDEQIPLVRKSLAESERELNAYRATRDSVDLTLETKSLLERLVALEAEISSMAINEAEISRRFTPQHPNYLSFKRQQADLVAERNRLNAKITSLPETQQKILSLMRDFEVNQAIYLSLKNKSQELEIVKASTVGNVRVLDVPEVLPRASSPKRLLIVILASIFGAILGVIYAIAKSLLNRGVFNAQELQDIGLNLYTTVPVSQLQMNFDKKQNAKRRGKRKAEARELLLAHEHPADMSIEAIRSLRTSLHFAMAESENNIVMFTSANAQVGKSFITSNLGVVLAESGQRVLVVDADMRRGYLHKRFSSAVNQGMSEILLGKCSVEEAVRKSPVENLEYISRGSIPHNPSELLMTEKFAQVMEQLSKEYDIILIDSPPVLAVTDASIIGRYASTVLMIVRFESCSLKSVAAAANRFNVNGVDIAGVVFNALEFKATNSYGGYGYYGYQYAYAYKYESLKE